MTGSEPGRDARARDSSARFIALLVGSVLLLAACGDQMASADQRTPPSSEAAPVMDDPVTPPVAPDMVRITGVRATQGNAVDCPQIRDDAGVLHPVSYLTTGVAIGDRVTVIGTYGSITTCKGTVLVVAEEHPPEG